MRSFKSRVSLAIIFLCLVSASHLMAQTVTLTNYNYDSVTNTTTFTYTVTSGSGPALSHWVLEFCGEASEIQSASESYEYGYDPTTGVINDIYNSVWRQLEFPVFHQQNR